MKNFQQGGEVIEVAAASAAVSPGQVVVVGAVLAVANGSALQGEPFNAQRVGVFVLPKVTGSAFTAGQPLMWDAYAGAFAAVGTAASGDVTGAAVAFEASAAGATECAVLLPGTIGAVAA